MSLNAYSTIGFVAAYSVRKAERRAPAYALCARHELSAVKQQPAKEKVSSSKRVRVMRRTRSVLQKEYNANVNLPHELILQLNRLLKGHRFCVQIAQLSNCRVAKFSGILFMRQPISSTCPDGVPPSMSRLQKNSDFEIVGIPPALVQRAAKKVNMQLNSGPVLQLCAVFEKFGMDGNGLNGNEEYAKWKEEDIKLQMECWCDYGESLRTETDVLHPEGADLFLEPLSDVLD